MQTEVIFSYPQDFHSQVMCKGERKNGEETIQNPNGKQFKIESGCKRLEHPLSWTKIPADLPLVLDGLAGN
jgi:hypothetical protein